MYKVVINNCYGGFGLSQLALHTLHEKYPEMVVVYEGYLGEESMYLKDNIQRHDSRLIEIVEELGSEDASGDCAELKVEVLLSPMYRISEYDGFETLYQPEGFEWRDASKQ